mmetsp:Transcript_31180/g.64643  ORF Transcript_31180/g.64643 Transcript_31180/m.64643 type:complete len:204 (+) Transcript_31180:106-717(+)
MADLSREVTAIHAPGKPSSVASTSLSRSSRRRRAGAPRVERMEVRYCMSVASWVRPEGESVGIERMASTYSCTTPPVMRASQCCMKALSAGASSAPSSPPVWSNCSGSEKRCSAICVTYGRGEEEKEGRCPLAFLFSPHTRSFPTPCRCLRTNRNAVSKRNSSTLPCTPWSTDGERTRVMNSLLCAREMNFSNAGRRCLSPRM